MLPSLRIGSMGRLALRTLARGSLRERIFFVHVPKCGGVSISNAIARKYGLGARLGRSAFNVDPAASSSAAEECGVDLQQFRRYLVRYAGSREGVRYVSGHVEYGVDALPTGEWRLVTVLRDPVEKWFSQYFYNRYKESQHSRLEVELEEFIESPLARAYGNDYLRYLGTWECRAAPSVANAVENLHRFELVGVLERLDSFVSRFEERFGVRLQVTRRNGNPVPAHVRAARIDEGLRRRVAELCAPNRAVYEEALRFAGAGAARQME